jgi:hypothetical protein
MKRIILIMALMLGASLLLSQTGLADQQTFTLNATVPTATSVGFTLMYGDTAKVLHVMTGTNMDFGTLKLDTANNPATNKPYNVFRPLSTGPQYFAIDVAALGAGSPNNVTFTYTEGTNQNATSPNPATNGLGYKANISLAKVVYVGPNPTDTTETAITSGNFPKTLTECTGANAISSTATAGGWLRAYIGINDGSNASWEPFTPADAPGAYDGSLLISSTVQ